MKRRTYALLGLAAGLGTASLLLTAIPAETTHAASADTFVIPADDGYGVADCVSAGSACVQVVADAWCEAQGYARSASFKAVDGPATPASAGAARPISVTCEN